MKINKKKLLERGRKEYEGIKHEEGMQRIRHERDVLYPAEFESLTGTKLKKGWKCPKCNSSLSRISSSKSKKITWQCSNYECGWKTEKET